MWSAGVHTYVTRGMWGHAPQGKFEFLSCLRWLLRPFKVDFDTQVGRSLQQFALQLEDFGVEAGEFGAEASHHSHWIEP